MNIFATVVIILIFGIAYNELLWWIIQQGKKPANDIQKTMRFFIGLNIVLAIFFQSIGSLLFAITISFYYFVVIPKRLLK